MLKRWLPLMDADRGSSGSGGEDDESKRKPSQVLEDVGTDPNKLARKIADLEYDNWKYRQRERPALEQQIETLKSQTLSDTDRTLFEAYKALGTPDDLQTIKIERDTLATENRQHQRAATIQRIATDQQLDAEKLGALLTDDLTLEVTETEQDGKKVANGVIVQGDQKLTLLEHPRIKPFADTLKVEPSGTQYVRQTGGSGTPKTREQLVAEETERKRASGVYG